MSYVNFVWGLLCTLLISSVTNAVTIDTVPVGNPGNAGEVQSQGTFGAVGYNYRIGKHEVTNAQYVEFLNGVDPTGTNTLALYNSSMSSDANGGINFNGGAANGSKYEIKSARDNNPVVWVSWYDSIRFANWMHNGMGSGDTENGAYTLLGGTPTPSNGNSITRNSGAKWWLSSEDEWYKAAYHKNDGATENYWDYPTSTNAAPYSDQPPGSDAPTQSNTGNFRNGDGVANGYDDGYAVTGSDSIVTSQNYLTDIGAYTLSTSPYGAFDQGGNVWEWNEALIRSSFRGRRGGSWLDTPVVLPASWRSAGDPAFASVYIGFRVASIAIPEPSTLLLLGFGSLAVLWQRRCPRSRLAQQSAETSLLEVMIRGQRFRDSPLFHQQKRKAIRQGPVLIGTLFIKGQRLLKLRVCGWNHFDKCFGFKSANEPRSTNSRLHGRQRIGKFDQHPGSSHQSADASSTSLNGRHMVLVAGIHQRQKVVRVDKLSNHSPGFP
jgi:formylglycine-generating enzyme required for sulfatase activity